MCRYRVCSRKPFRLGGACALEIPAFSRLDGALEKNSCAVEAGNKRDLRMAYLIPWAYYVSLSLSSTSIFLPSPLSAFCLTFNDSLTTTNTSLSDPTLLHVSCFAEMSLFLSVSLLSFYERSAFLLPRYLSYWSTYCLSAGKATTFRDCHNTLAAFSIVEKL